jgi:hypothetical protein
MKNILMNFLSCFIPVRKIRNRVRIKLNNPIRKWTKFAMSFSNKKHPKVKYTYGFRCKNFVVNIDDKFVFKFPLKNDGYEIAMREKRITDVFRPISSIKIPNMEIVDFNGLAVRKYECIKGVGFHSLDRKTQNLHADKMAKQLAQFLYIVGKADPKEIADLKINKNDRVAIMHGWTQNDLWDNFIINPKTFDIVGIIDWEEAGFNDFHGCFTYGTSNKVVKTALLREYLNLYLKNSKK